MQFKTNLGHPITTKTSLTSNQHWKWMLVLHFCLFGGWKSPFGLFQLKVLMQAKDYHTVTSHIVVELVWKVVFGQFQFFVFISCSYHVHKLWICFFSPWTKSHNPKPGWFSVIRYHFRIKLNRVVQLEDIAQSKLATGPH